MSGELISLRVLTVFVRDHDRDRLRLGAGRVSVPIDVLEAETAAAATGVLAGGDIDIVFLDAALAPSDRAAVLAAARAAKAPPFVLLAGSSQEEASKIAAAESADAGVLKPPNTDDAKDLVERCVRMRLPKRILVVDDSSTMRGIVRRIFASTRFRLEVTEAEEGVTALKEIATGKFDLALIDYNMPGLNGLETLAEIKRLNPHIAVLVMTSTRDDALAERARAAGAAAFLKKPFFPADIDAVLHSLFGFK
jgi:CheY-like chemotaxis protein